MFKKISIKRSTGIACSFVALLAISCSSAGINGKWVADLPGREGQTRQQTFNFKAEGNKLTGTVTGRQGAETPISDGEINGDDISFSVTQNVRGNEVKVVYKGKLAGKEIKFTRTREGGNREGASGDGGENQPAQGPLEFTARKA